MAPSAAGQRPRAGATLHAAAASVAAPAFNSSQRAATCSPRWGPWSLLGVVAAAGLTHSSALSLEWHSKHARPPASLLATARRCSATSCGAQVCAPLHSLAPVHWPRLTAAPTRACGPCPQVDRRLAKMALALTHAKFEGLRFHVAVRPDALGLLACLLQCLDKEQAPAPAIGACTRSSKGSKARTAQKKG